jgi:hypothetical protein
MSVIDENGNKPSAKSRGEVAVIYIKCRLLIRRGEELLPTVCNYFSRVFVRVLFN